jgi:hypothetical protein
MDFFMACFLLEITEIGNYRKMLAVVGGPTAMRTHPDEPFLSSVSNSAKPWANLIIG